MTTSKKMKYILIVSILLAFILLVVLSCQFIKINNLKQTQSNLEASYQEIQSKISEFSQQNDLLISDSNLDDYAHSALNYGKENELWFSGK